MTTDNVPTSGLLIIDGANVVGSRPDGWWRDRAGAAARLRDRLAAAVERGVFPAAVEVVLVVEGKARGIGKSDRLRVLAASGTGDDSIVGVVRAAEAEALVVTADRGLRERVTAEGGSVVGPSTLYRWLE